MRPGVGGSGWDVIVAQPLLEAHTSVTKAKCWFDSGGWPRRHDGSDPGRGRRSLFEVLSVIKLFFNPPPASTSIDSVS